MPIPPIEHVLKIVTLKDFDCSTSCMPSSPKESISPWYGDTPKVISLANIESFKSPNYSIVVLAHQGVCICILQLTTNLQNPVALTKNCLKGFVQNKGQGTSARGRTPVSTLYNPRINSVSPPYQLCITTPYQLCITPDFQIRGDTELIWG